MKITTVVMIVIFVLSFFVRIVGTNPGHWEYHPDEPTTYITARDMIINHDINPRRFDYPAGMPLIHMVAFNSFFVPVELMKLFFEKPSVLISGLIDIKNFPGNISEDLFGPRGIKALFWSRYITATLGAFSVIALYALCNVLFSNGNTNGQHSFVKLAFEGSFYSRTIGLISSFFLAFNYLNVLRSHLALPDIPNAFFMITALIAIALLLKKDSPRNYYIAAVLIGLVFAIKFQIFIVLPFIFAHVLWSIRKKSFVNLFRKEVFFAGIIIIVTFFAINPYLPFHLKPVPRERRIESFITANEVTAKRYAFGSNVFNQFAPFFLYKWGLGKAVTISVLLGFVLMIFVSPMRSFFLMTLIVPFMYSFLYYGGTGAGYYVRNYATIIAFILIFAGFFYTEVIKYALKFSISKVVVVCLIGILVVVVSWDQIVRSSALAYYWSKPWLHVTTAQWAGKYLPKDAQIEESSGLVQGHMRQFGDFTNLVTWGRDQYYSVTSLAEMEEEGSDFILLVSNQIHHQTIYWMNSLTFSELLSFDDVPYEKLDSTYLGLSVYQMFDYAVYNAYYPVVYPNQFFLISKIPKTNPKSTKIIRSITHDSSKSIQTFSPFILPIEEGKMYQVVGKIKNLREVLKPARNVFLRVDLYASENDAKMGKRGAYLAVSSRLWGGTDWQELKATTVKVPKGIHFMKVNLQADKDKQANANLDAITISEVEINERYPDIPIKPVRIPSTYIYPKAIF